MYYNNKKLALSVFWILLGVTLIVLSVIDMLDSTPYSGMGGGLVAVGALQVWRNLKYRRDADYRAKIDTEAADERNKFLRMKSWSWAGYVAILAEGIGAVIAMAMGEQTIQLVLSYCVYLLIAVYYVAYVILNRKY